ncbi:MAG: glycosyl hydrolase [Candidatus Omnitrophota bacterium]
MSNHYKKLSTIIMISIAISILSPALTLGDTKPSTISLCSAFDPNEFADPDSVHWPGYFWLWNAPLDQFTILEQLRDMASHGARSVCMLPMPRAFRPNNTNNSMDPDYLTPEFFDRVKWAVDEAAKLGMKWWLYDEGGWPSGQALGKVIEGHPEFAQHRLVREKLDNQKPITTPSDALAIIEDGLPPKVYLPGETWTPSSSNDDAYLYRVLAKGYADLLNPEAVKRFIALTHEGYCSVLQDHFGKTVLFTFTDEPNAPNIVPEKSMPWTPRMVTIYKNRFGKEIFPLLPKIFHQPDWDFARARIEYYDLWTSRFRDAYFKTIRDWDRSHGLASGGHLNGEDQTINAIRYGFGQALRQLRAMDVPGVDLIWRQLFPGMPNQHFFPKYASSAAHYNGTRYSFTESFCVYGNGLTPAQMKWLVDYQYVRGLNLLVMGCYPFSTKDHHMTGERPHFGRCNPLWDHLPEFHAYVARLGYALSAGRPKIETALYYPVRDLWAMGESAYTEADSHDRLANELLTRQCDFDLIDDDVLADETTKVENGVLMSGAMRYKTIVCDGVQWMQPEALAKLKQFAASGGKVLCTGRVSAVDEEPNSAGADRFIVGEIDEITARVQPTAQIDPPSRSLRAAARSTDDGEIVFLFNEENESYEGVIHHPATYARLLEPQTGRLIAAPKPSHSLPIRLQPDETRLFLFSDEPLPADSPVSFTEDIIALDEEITAQPRRRFIAGEHDFEIVEPVENLENTSWWGDYKGKSLSFADAAVWKNWLGEDYSGEVDYTASFNLPMTWDGAPLELETGAIEYAATIILDGKTVGSMLWSPWRLALPPCQAGKHQLIIRTANTLANELTSERVVNEWTAKKGPGWPSPYHARTIIFERESRYGGLLGPIQLRRMKKNDSAM